MKIAQGGKIKKYIYIYICVSISDTRIRKDKPMEQNDSSAGSTYTPNTSPHEKRHVNFLYSTFKPWTEDMAYAIVVLNVTYHRHYQKEDSNLSAI